MGDKQSAAPVMDDDVTDATSIRHLVRVVDQKSGEVIPHVLTADSRSGKISRREVVAGNLVRMDNRFHVIEEVRDVRVERIGGKA